MDTSELLAAVRRLGGVARTSTLAASGAGRHRIQRALETGALRRVRRGWVALPEADPALVAAARAGVVLTCVTAAARHGLWVLADDRFHVAAPPHAGRACPQGAVVHWATPPVPRHPDDLVDSVENALVAVSRCQPDERALAVWESAFRLGAVQRERMRGIRMPAAARAHCDAASLLSDSGLETFLPHRLRWLRLPLRQQVWLLDRPVDLLIGDRLVVQIDGGHHVDAQRAADVDHDARLLLAGYHVIRVTYAQVVDAWPTVHDRIVAAVAQGLHLAR